MRLGVVDLCEDVGGSAIIRVGVGTIRCRALELGGVILCQGGDGIASVWLRWDDAGWGDIFWVWWVFDGIRIASS